MLNIFDQYNRGWQQMYGGAEPQIVQNPTPGGPAPPNAPGQPWSGPPSGPNRPIIDPRYPETWPPAWRRTEEPFGYGASAPANTGPNYADFSRHIDDIKAEAKGTGASGGSAPFVGAPLSGNQTTTQKYDEYGQPISDPGVLSSTDTSGIAASGEGRANLTPPSGDLLKVGGYSGEKPSSGGSGDQSTAQMGKQLGQGLRGLFGGGGGGAAGASDQPGNLLQGYMGYTGDPGTGGGGIGGGSGMSGMDIASGISGALTSFGKTVAAANAPVSVDPSKWAGPVPAPYQFMPPTLSRNVGGNWNY